MYYAWEIYGKKIKVQDGSKWQLGPSTIYKFEFGNKPSRLTRGLFFSLGVT